MTTVLTLAVLALVAIAIWQMTKIFELSQLKSEHAQIANDNDNKNNGYLLFAFLIFIYGITIFSFWKYGKFLLPDAASEHGATCMISWSWFLTLLFLQCRRLTQGFVALFWVQV